MDPPTPPAAPTAMTRRFGLFFLISVLFLAAVVPYLLYRNFLSQNFAFATLDGYPSKEEIAAQLNCTSAYHSNTSEYLTARESAKPSLFNLPLQTKGRNI